MEDGFITIIEDRYIEMARAELFLSILDAHGVANWEGYYIAHDAYTNLVKECPDVVG